MHWAAPCRPVRPVLAQPEDQRKSTESATEREIDGLIDRGILYVLSQVMEQHPTVCSRWAAHDFSLSKDRGGRGRWLKLQKE